MAGEAERVDAYLDTVKRIEPDIASLDADASLASIAISLKRIADALDRWIIADRIHDAIYNAVVTADRQRSR
jgi:hypothetical protein